LLYGEGVQAGEGGYFEIRSGVTMIEELAVAHEKVFGAIVEVVREGSGADLEAKLARQRIERARARYIEYMSEAAAVLAGKELWENSEVTLLAQFEKATSLEEWLSGGKKNKKQKKRAHL
jgi:hypothetical protein